MLINAPPDGLLLLLILTALVLAPVGAFAVRWRYKAAVKRLMQASSGRPALRPDVREQISDEVAASNLTIEVRKPQGLGAIPPTMIVFGTAYFMAGSAHALCSAVLHLFLGGFELSPARLLIVFLIYATPAVFSALYVMGMSQWHIVLGAAAWMIGVIVLSIPFSSDAFMVWQLSYIVALPLVMGVLLVNRKIGTIAPFLVIPAMLLAMSVLLALDAMVLGLQLLESVAGAWAFGFSTVCLGLACGWLSLALTARQYRRGHLSELMLQSDVLWLLISTAHVIAHLNASGWLALLMYLPFAVYRLVLFVASKMAKVPQAPEARARLLLLRVFGFQKRQAEFHRVFLNAWRRSGPVALIGAPDVALDTIDPPELFAFVSGRLRRLFVNDPETVKEDLAAPRARSMDGLFEIDDFYCFDDTWQPSVQALIDASKVIVMDLRGFDSQNMGCIFEIGELFKRTPTSQLAFIVDETTDQAVLTNCMHQAWAAAQETKSAHIVLWQVETIKALRQLLRQLRT